MRVLIINYNRLGLPKKLADWCFNHGVDPVFIDNHSDYKPLLAYYKKDCPYQVIRLTENYGHRVVWVANILNRLKIKGGYIVTDPDLDLTGIPDDFLSVLKEGLELYPWASKCGFSLEIKDLPEGKVKRWETQFWNLPLGDDCKYFNAPIDTTFALYRAGSFPHVNCLDFALRTNRPYTAKHVPWDYEKKGYKGLPDDEKYYYKTANDSASGRKRVMIQQISNMIDDENISIK